MSVPATLIRKSTGEILKRDLLPADPTQEIPGLDPDLEWLIDYVPFSSPLYDSRIYQLVTTQEVTTAPHPDYPLYNQFLITYSTERKPVEEIKEHIINKERAELTNHVDYLPKLAVLACGILFRELDGLTLNATETYIKNRTIDAAVKIFTNHQRRKQLEAEAEQVETPDIDSGWAAADDNEPL